MPNPRTALLINVFLAAIYPATAGNILFAIIPGQVSVSGMQQLAQEMASRQHSVLVSSFRYDLFRTPAPCLVPR